MNWFDSHCHLADSRLADQLEQTLAKSRAAGVSGWLQAGYEKNDWLEQLRLREKLGVNALVSCGLHPWKVHAASDADLQSEFAFALSLASKIQAIGETGLDFGPKIGRSSQAKQVYWFEKHLAWSLASQIPVILHIVRADAEAMPILRANWPSKNMRGLVHAFSGSIAQAQNYLDLGLHLSLGAAALASPKHQAMIQSVPAERLLVETDAPDQLPQVLRQEQGLPAAALNEPAYLPWIAERIAKIRGEDREEVLNRSTKNLLTLLRIN